MAALRIPLLAPSFAVAILALAGGAAQAGDAASAHGSWRECLGHAYVSGAVLTGRDLAADAAFRACREQETAYLTALSASPLLDADDIAQARPELVARARAQLLELLPAGPRAVAR